MEPISILAQAAAAAFGTAAISEVGKKAIGEVWSVLRNAVQRRFGAAPEVPKLLDELRAQPSGPESNEILQKIGALRLADDPETREILEHLSKIIAQNTPVATATVYAGKIYGSVNNSGTINMTIGKD